MELDNPSPDPLCAANELRVSCQWKAAIKIYNEILVSQPQEVEAWAGLALCHEELGDIVAARQALLNCLEHRPQTPFAHFRLGWLSYRDKEFTKALVHYLRATDLVPHWYEPYYHAAVCFQELRRYPEAITRYQRALYCKSDLPVIWYHAAKALKDGGLLDAALPFYRRALEMKPDYAEARYGLGLLHLLRGNWLAGWIGYEMRWQGSDRATAEHRPVTNLPLWRGEDVPSDSGIVVYAEQGMGDSIMCFRYAGWLKKRFCRVKFSESSPLVALFQQNVPGGVEVVTRIRQAIDEAGYTHHIHTLSLPAVFQAVPENVDSKPYLKAPIARKKFWHQRLSGETRFKVGLVWQGGWLSHAPGRDMAFSDLLPLLELEGFRWFSLQKKEVNPIDPRLTNWMSEVGDFDDTAALIENLELIITVDTAVAHLAGALGKPVWLLNRFESEWRWMRGKENTPWYSSMRIFSQQAPGDWVGVMAQVRATISMLSFTA